MGRRKIEIKAIKDDRNRSVTFLKRKFGLFKKAHELSVLCSADVAVIIFGANKKLYEYSSSDMRDLITRYQYHGVPNEHKGPSDFNGGNDEEDEEDGDGTPPRGQDGLDPHMMPPHFQQPFAHIRHHTPSASPPIPNGVPFQPHPGHHVQRAHTPQPIGSRPSSRNDLRRIGPSMVPQPVGPQAPHPGITYMPTPPIYNPPTSQPPPMMSQPNAHYPYQPPPQPHPQPQPPAQGQPQGPPQPHPHPHPHPQPQPYMEDRRPPPPPPVYSSQPPSQTIPITRTEPSPPQPSHHPLPPHHNIPHISPPPQPERRLQDPPPPPPMEPKREGDRPPQPSLLNTDMAIKKLPQRKSHSIFTPIEENRSILSQHLASFEEPVINRAEVAANAMANRAHSVDVASVNRNGPTSSPPRSQRSNTQTSMSKPRTVSESSASDAFTPPSRSNSLKAGSARPRGPRLTVQIPDGGSEAGSAAGDSTTSPRAQAEPAAQAPRRNSAMVLPPPSPSASALLSAGATGPPNPFARPVPQQSMNIDTPASALPSRFLNTEFLPSPSSFYQDWNFRGSDSNTLPSPLNFATPIVGSGPSFLREEVSHATSNGTAPSSNTLAPTSNNVNSSSGSHNSQAAGATKRKSPEYGASGESDSHETSSEVKRVKTE
ncbi:MADS-box transcription factor [Paramyrothecium foliicola]|nr:MADS-box transcription factor [Paramyrothecium foliicola]